MLKKIALTILTFFFIATGFVSFAAKEIYAQEPNPWYDQSYQEWFTKVYDTNTSPPDEIFGERYTAAQVSWVMYALRSAIFRFIPRDAELCIIQNGDGNACMTAAIAANPPVIEKREDRSVFAILFNGRTDASGVNYVRQKLAKVHMISEAQAQGFGFGALSPLQQIWTVTRNLAYAFSIIVVLIFAFMIMFRVKLNPQTVVSIQSALPKVIIALVLATFSYAIAGFAVDLAYVAIGLVAYIFSQTGIFVNAGWGDIFSWITSGPANKGVFGWFVLLSYYYVGGISQFASSATGILTNWNIGISPQVIEMISFVLLVVLGLWGIIAMFKIVFLVFKTYVTIIVLTITGPIQIILGSITSSGGFGGWVKNLASNLAIYPVIGAMFLLVTLFLSAAYPSYATGIGQSLGGVVIQSPLGESDEYWYPPLTFGDQDQTSGYDPLPFLWVIASVGLLSIIPTAGSLVTAAFSGRGIDAAAAIGGGVAGMAAAPGQLAGGATSLFNKYRNIGRAIDTPAAAIARRRHGGMTEQEIWKAAQQDVLIKNPDIAARARTRHDIRGPNEPGG